MNTKVFMVLRILLGVFVVVFGLDKFLHFIPMDHSTLSESAIGYMGGLAASKTMILVSIVEIVAGLALIFNKFGALMALILMSVSVNAVLFHATLDPVNIAGSLVMLILNIAVLYGYRHRYSDLLQGY